MAVLTVYTAARAGTTFTPAAAAGGGDSFPNTGKEILYVNNGSGGSITVTIAVTATTDGDLVVANRTVAVGAGLIKLIGPFPTGTYNDVNSRVQLTYSGVTTLTVGAISPV